MLVGPCGALPWLPSCPCLRTIKLEVGPGVDDEGVAAALHEATEQLEELLLPGDVRRKHHRADKVRKLRELGVSEVPGKETQVRKVSKLR